MQHKIYLIGYRGTGKSTIGGLLATALDATWVDIDHLVSGLQAMPISEIVAQKGWDYFRMLEAEMLRKSVSGPDRVIATGGGAVIHQEVWDEITDQNFVVWLSADIAVLTNRLTPIPESDAERPSLTGEPTHLEIEQVLAEREPLYRELADVEIDTGKLLPAEVVEQIVQAYHAWCEERES